MRSLANRGRYPRLISTVLGTLMVFVLVSSVLVLKPFAPKVEAATSSTLNFQARLLTNTGALVPDGNYSIQFKLYSASAGGSPVWTETYDNNTYFSVSSSLVRVASGYMTVNLGAQTAFGALNWDQDLYLTMNVKADGEMSPRLKLTAVPYAFRAGQLAKLTGANTSTLDFATQTAPRTILLPDEGGTLCIQASTNCSFAAATGATGYIQNTSSLQATSNFHISGTGVADTSLSTPTITTASGDLLLDPVGNTVIKGSGTTSGTVALNVTDSGSGSLLYVRNDGAVGIGTITPGARLAVVSSGSTDALLVNSGASTGAIAKLQSNGEDAVRLTTTASSANLISNPGFETNPTGWTALGSASVARNTSNKYFGTASLAVTTTAAAGDGTQFTYAFTPSTQYTLTFYTKLASGTLTQLRWGRQDNTGTGPVNCTAGIFPSADYTVLTTGWTRYSCTFTTAATVNTAFIYFKQNDATARTIYLDNVQLEASGASNAWALGTLNLNSIINSPLHVQATENAGNTVEVRAVDGTSVFSIDTINKTVNGNLLRATNGSSNAIQGTAISTGLYGVSGISAIAGGGVYGLGVDGYGMFGQSSGNSSGLFQTTNTGGTNANPTLVTRANTNQTANVLEAQNSGSVATFTIDSTGKVVAQASTNATDAFTVKGSAGSGGHNILGVDSTQDFVNVRNVLSTYAQNCGSCNSLDLSLLSGNAIGATSNSGNVIVDVGTATGTAGSITVGATSATATTIGRTGATTVNIQGGSGINIGSGGVANTIQVGNTTGAVAQTINIGNNATASSTNTITIGSLIGSSALTLQSGSGNITFNTGGSTDTGSITIQSGTAANANSTGNLTLDVGAHTGSTAIGNAGIVSIGTNNALSVGIGRTGNANTSISGSSVSLTGASSINLNSTSTTISGDATFNTGLDHTLAVATQTTGGAAGNNLTVASATGNGAGTGGSLTIRAGTGGTTGAGGDTTIRGGAGGGGNTNGGNLTLSGGAKAGSGASGSVIIKPQASNDSTTAIQIQNAAGSNLLTVDTSNGKIILGKAGASGIAGTLVFQDAANANTVTVTTGTTSSSYTINLPLSGPAVSQCLQTDTVTASQLVFGSCSGAAGANVSLSNLSTVAINTALLPGSAAIDLGSTANPFRTGYLNTSLVFTNGTNANTITLNTAVPGSSYSLTLPTTGPGTGQCLQSDPSTASQLIFSSCSGAGGANAQLSNLSSVAINTALLPTSSNTIDLGSATVPFRSSYTKTTAFFLNSTNANTVGLTAGATTGSGYTLTLPLSTPTTSQCLQTDSSTATQLVFGSCSAAAGTLQNAYDNDGSGEADIVTSATAKNVLIKAGGGFDGTTKIFHVQNSSAAELLGVDTQNTVVRIGSGTTDGTGVVLVLDSYSTAGDPTVSNSLTNGAMYYNTAYHEFRCFRGIDSTDADGEWAPCSSVPIDRGFEINEEFMNFASAVGGNIFGSNNWNSVAINSVTCRTGGSGSYVTDGSSDHPGILSMNTSTTASSGCAWQLAQTSNANVIPKANMIIKASIQLSGTASTTQIMRVGITDEGTSASSPVNGVWIEADPSVPDTHWRYCYGDGSAAQCTSSSVTLTTGWTPIDIRINAVGTGSSNIDYFINGTKFSKTSVTMSTTNKVTPYVICKATSTSSAVQTCNIDYYQFRGTTSARR